MPSSAGVSSPLLSKKNDVVGEEKKATGKGNVIATPPSSVAARLEAVQHSRMVGGGVEDVSQDVVKFCVACAEHGA